MNNTYHVLKFVLLVLNHVLNRFNKVIFTDSEVVLKPDDEAIVDMSSEGSLSEVERLRHAVREATLTLPSSGNSNISSSGNR